ncbi:hypothetical protein ACMFMG_010861 [Clarireedia jacksonii]
MHLCVCSTNWDDIQVSSPTNIKPQIDTMISATRRVIRCADPDLGAKWSFRHVFASDYCFMDSYLLWISYFPTHRHFPRKRLRFDNINLRAGAIDGIFFFEGHLDMRWIDGGIL